MMIDMIRIINLCRKAVRQAAADCFINRSRLAAFQRFPLQKSGSVFPLRGTVLFLVILCSSVPVFSSSPSLVVQSGHTAGIRAVGISADGSLAVTGMDNAVKLWDTASGLELRTLKGHTSAITDVDFSPDGNKVLSASGDNTVKVWDVRTGALLLDNIKIRTNLVSRARFSPDGRFIATAGDIPRIHDASTGEEIKQFGVDSNITEALSRILAALAWSPDGKTIYIGDDKPEGNCLSVTKVVILFFTI